ncbi:hypothetical protein [Sinomicrobium weinanense]|uniref:Uncharacterized protein n=1 Tax=Sinomicrobium weinanense TaxID=2842200 RepID=A0A926JQX8_9FLAO|nr:hypothetical protein [Sinomicrobium weinanense]MBC9795857.1 hypothetical protein [Sinomicrobium weinanense]MBU3125377.1 hypothetical protein [Sinomicrobium weinanense]
MKKLYILFVFLSLSHLGISQNQYPTATGSSILIDGGGINVMRPATTGGWARGISYFKAKGDIRYGGIGMYGGGETPHYIYITHGETPWKGNGLFMLPNGYVGIGTTSPDAKLAVNGVVHSKEVKVDLSGWSDFVFESGYTLPTLEEVERHIQEKGHLKDIPSAKEVGKEGIHLGAMDAKLLQKIEELTLYTIAQEKQLQFQKEKLKERESRLSAMEVRIEQLETMLTNLIRHEDQINANNGQ